MENDELEGAEEFFGQNANVAKSFAGVDLNKKQPKKRKRPGKEIEQPRKKRKVEEPSNTKSKVISRAQIYWRNALPEESCCGVLLFKLVFTHFCVMILQKRIFQFDCGFFIFLEIPRMSSQTLKRMSVEFAGQNLGTALRNL